MTSNARLLVIASEMHAAAATDMACPQSLHLITDVDGGTLKIQVLKI